MCVEVCPEMFPLRYLQLLLSPVKWCLRNFQSSCEVIISNYAQISKNKHDLVTDIV